MRTINTKILFLSLILSSGSTYAGSFRYFAWIGGMKSAEKKSAAVATTTATSTTTATTTSSSDSNSNYDMLSRMNADYSTYMKSTSVGERTKVSGGTLYRTSTGALFVDENGKEVTLPESNPDFNSLALSSPSLALELYNRYGFLPSPGTPSSGVLANGTPTTKTKTDTSTDAQSREPAVEKNNSDVQVQNLVKLFNSIEGQLAMLRNKARDLRKIIRKKAKEDVDCSGSSVPDNVKSDCSELVKTNTAYAEAKANLAKTNSLLSAYENATQTASTADESSLMKTALVKKSDSDEMRETIAMLGSNE